MTRGMMSTPASWANRLCRACAGLAREKYLSMSLFVSLPPSGKTNQSDFEKIHCSAKDNDWVGSRRIMKHGLESFVLFSAGEGGGAKMGSGWLPKVGLSKLLTLCIVELRNADIRQDREDQVWVIVSLLQSSKTGQCQSVLRTKGHTLSEWPEIHMVLRKIIQIQSLR